MPESRLLERLKRFEKSSASGVAYQPTLEVKSIVEHLRRLLNTRIGSASIAADYGVPDLTNVIGNEYSQMVADLKQNIQQVIMKYEPRLKDVQIQIESDRDDVFSLRFKAQGYMVGGENIPIVFETVISTDGKIDIAQ